MQQNAQRDRFGQSSEKSSYVLAEEAGQSSLFNEAEVVQDVKAPEPTEETFTVAAHERRKKRTAEELVNNDFFAGHPVGYPAFCMPGCLLGIYLY